MSDDRKHGPESRCVESLERRVAELEHQTRQHRAMLDASMDMYFSVDRQGVFHTAGGRRLADFGVMPDDVLGSTLEILAGDEAGSYQARHDRVFESGEPIIYEHTFEFRGVTKTDRTIVFPIRGPHGEIEQVGVVCHDIGERVSAEAALKEALDEAARAQRLLLALSQAAEAIQRAHSPDEVYATIGAEIQSLGYRVGILLLTEDGEGLELAYTNYDSNLLRAAEKLAGLSTKGYAIPLAPDHPMTKVLETAESVFFDQGHSEHVAWFLPRRLKPLAGPLVRLMRLEQSLVAPLVIRGRVAGVLAISGGALSVGDLPAVTVFANQAAAALEHARLVQALQQRARALGDSQERYRTLFENMAQGAFYQRLDGTLVDVNPAALEMFGLTRDQMLGRTSMHPRWKVVTPDGVEIPGQEHPSMLALSTGQPVRDFVVGVYNPVREDYVRLAVNATPQLRPGETAPYQVFVTLHDITERKRAEDALRESEERFRVAFERAPIGIALVGLDFTFLRSNQAFRDLHGYRDEELRDMTIADITHPDDRDENMALQHQLARGEIDDFRFEKRFLHKDGSVSWGLLVASLVRDLAGEPLYFLGQIVDITERRHAEQALRESEELLRVVIETSPNCIFVKDERGQYLLANKAIAELYDTPAAEMLGKTDLELAHRDSLKPEEAEQFIADDTEVIRTQEPKTVPAEPFTRADGTLCWFHTLKVPFTAPGEQRAMLGVAIDITELQEAQDALRRYSEDLEDRVEARTQELQEAQERLVRREKLAVLGQLSGSVGHELRNPLAVISNAVYYLKMVCDRTDETTHEYLELIGQEVDNAAKIVSDLLDFARIKSVERSPVGIRDLVAQVLEKYPAPQGIELGDLPSADLPAVYVDSRQMEQVLTNLVTNAYQAMASGGKLSFAAGVDRDEKEACSVRLEVSDTGCGIPAKSLPKIFEPLFTTKARGIGLGLAVSRNLVEANGGRIEVTSIEGEGTTFTLVLPCKEA